MEYLYIVNPANFTGNVLNTMPFVEKGAKHGIDILNSTYVHYCEGMTFEQYNQKHGGNLLALTWDEFNTQFYSNHLTSLCKPFAEVTEEAFTEALECLPPKRWTRGNGQEFFFLGECYTANLYSCYVRKGDKYFSALRPINTPETDLFNLC